MNFQPHLAQAILEDRKTVTRRRMSDNPRSPWYRERCRYTPGQVFTVNPGRGKVHVCKAKVLQVNRVTLGGIPHREALAEGFSGVSEFKEAWEAINGSWDPQETLWRVEFERWARYAVCVAGGNTPVVHRHLAEDREGVDAIVERLNRGWWLVDQKAGRRIELEEVSV